jgi:hypothetical protein
MVIPWFNTKNLNNMKMDKTLSMIEETLKAVDKGNTVVMYIYAVETSKRVYQTSFSIPINSNTPKFKEHILTYYSRYVLELWDKLMVNRAKIEFQRSYDEKIQGLSYDYINYDKYLTKDEFKLAETRYWKSFNNLNHPNNN